MKFYTGGMRMQTDFHSCFNLNHKAGEQPVRKLPCYNIF